MSEVLEPYKELYTNTDKFITLVTGGRGSGKSFEVMRFIQRLTFEQGHKILLSRYTLSSANISVIPEFEEKVQLEGTQEYFKITEKDAINLMTGSEVMFRGIRTSSGNQTANLKSIQGLTTFVVDEGEEWVSESDYDKLVLSIRQKGIQNRIIIIMNPSNINHFVYRKYIKDSHKLVNIDGVNVQISTHPNVLHIHTTYLDNSHNLSNTFLDEVEYIKENDKKKGTKQYDHIVVGRWSDMSEGAIYTDWQVVEEMPKDYKKRAIGLDFGSNDPTAIIDVMLSDGEIWVDEWCYSQNMINTIPKNGIERISIEGNLKQHNVGSIKIIADCQAKSAIQELKNVGFNIVPCIKGQGSIIDGIRVLQKFKINVTRRSENIIMELQNYVWDKTRVDVPIDKYNHSLDAIRYVASMEFTVKRKRFAPFAECPKVR